LQATITLEYDSAETAAATAKAIAPDNFIVPGGLKIETVQENNKVVTQITLEGKLATLIATIDDLLENASTAEKTLNAIKTRQY